MDPTFTYVITGNCSLPRVEDHTLSQRYNASFDEHKEGSETSGSEAVI